MELLLDSPPSIGETTISPLLVDGRYECDVLEDQIREVPGQPVSKWKIHGRTAIPAGRYQIIISMSPRFKKMLPRLLKVPGFDGVLIHSLNTAEQTEGCLGVGKKISDTRIAGGMSQDILKKLQAKIQAALGMKQEVWITVKRPMEILHPGELLSASNQTEDFMPNDQNRQGQDSKPNPTPQNTKPGRNSPENPSKSA